MANLAFVEQKLSVIGKDPDACWFWGTRKGYYTLNFNGLIIGAHRLIYTLFVGVIPRGKVVDHKCNQPNCVNPRHLQAITQKANVDRAPTSLNVLNGQKTHCINGHEFTPENTYVRPDRKGRRDCKECKRIRGRK